MLVQHLYIHIPLCKDICTFCGFKRELLCNYDSQKVIDYLVNNLKKYQTNQFKTIYIGGGTPNVFEDKQLDYFLSQIKPLLQKQYEFTIECNPDLITLEQVKILKKNLVNRISLGVQSTNNKLLKILNRTHTIEDCQNALKLLRKSGFNNISIDFMYALPLMKVKDAIDAVNFAIQNNVQHVSFYGLDIKPNSVLKKQKYQINLDEEADQLDAIIRAFNKSNFKRYEVSNWALSKKYQSQHNLAYWLTKDWAAVGYGACGLENKIYYEFEGSINQPKKTWHKLSDQEYYQQILMMGLRLKNGIDISKEPYKSAYNFYKNKLKFVVIRNNILKSKNINLLNNSLIDIF